MLLRYPDNDARYLFIRVVLISQPEVPCECLVQLSGRDAIDRLSSPYAIVCFHGSLMVEKVEPIKWGNNFIIYCSRNVKKRLSEIPGEKKEIRTELWR